MIGSCFPSTLEYGKQSVAIYKYGARTRKQRTQGKDRDEMHMCNLGDKTRPHITRRVRTFQKAADRATALQLTEFIWMV